MSQPDVSVVVCTYNRAMMLREALRSLVAQQLANAITYEIIVVDDGSTDETASVVHATARSATIPVRYVRGESRGVACARNAGLRAATGTWIAFFDDDQIAETDWLSQLVAPAIENGHHCVGGSIRLLLPAGQAKPLSSICRAVLGETPTAPGLQPYPRKRYPGTGNVLLSRAVIDTVRGFDQSPLGAGEDTVFFSRMYRAGFQAWYQPHARAYHVIPLSRLQEEHLLRYSFRHGAALALRDYEQRNVVQQTILCIARIGQALIINFPLLTLSLINGKKAERLGRKCLLWRAFGYTAYLSYLQMPYLSPKGNLLDALDFRTDRERHAVTENSQ